MRRALVAVCVAALAVPASAAAHASLRHEFPAFGERLHSSPAEVTLRFDQVVDALPGGIRVFDVNGRNYAGPVHARDRMLVAGVWTFGVRVPAPNVVDDSVGAGGPTTAEHVVRWLWFVALALLLGGIGFRLLVVRAPLPRRFWIVTGVAAIGTLEVAIVAFLLRCEDALQLPFGNF